MESLVSFTKWRSSHPIISPFWQCNPDLPYVQLSICTNSYVQIHMVIKVAIFYLIQIHTFVYVFHLYIYQYIQTYVKCYTNAKNLCFWWQWVISIFHWRLNSWIRFTDSFLRAIMNNFCRVCVRNFWFPEKIRKIFTFYTKTDDFCCYFSVNRYVQIYVQIDLYIHMYWSVQMNFRRSTKFICIHIHMICICKYVYVLMAGMVPTKDEER